MDAHLLEALAAIDRPGDMAAAGDWALAMPGLEAEGLGTVGLPLPKNLDGLDRAPGARGVLEERPAIPFRLGCA